MMFAIGFIIYNNPYNSDVELEIAFDKQAEGSNLHKILWVLHQNLIGDKYFPDIDNNNNNE